MRSWNTFLTVLLATLAGLLLIAAGMIWIANPYGNLLTSPLRHVLMDDNQRFQYPSVVRSGRYDSIIIGTSTSRLLEPARLEAALGGRFANLALNSGTAWEQWRFARLFAHTSPARRTLLIGLDHVWCDAAADTNRITPRGFPEWMFDADPWNDLPHMLNSRTLEIAGRRLGYALGLTRERWPHNGYEIFVPPDERYDLKRAREHIYGAAGPPPTEQRPPSTDLNPSPIAKTSAIAADPSSAGAYQVHAFPALVWLSELLERGNGWERIIVVIPPVHQSGLPKPGTAAFAREQVCKANVVALAKPNGRAVIDFRIVSSISAQDQNYWDPLHYRVPIATRIVEGLARALKTAANDPEGDYRILARE